MKILHFEELDSTNNYAKAHRGEGENLVVTALRQTGGRGTKGRSFASDEGGVYLTRLTFYRDGEGNFTLPVSKAFLIMASAAVAVCKTLEHFGLSPKIKWANDVFVNDRKICGILVENVFSGENVLSSTVGIGVNVNNALPEELKDIAVSMSAAAGRKFDREEVEKTLITHTEKLYPIEEYLARVGYLNRDVKLIFGDDRIPAYAVAVDREGGLLVDIQGERRRVTAGEVSLKL